jgi:O-antigen/teichoic acid export membrane protein
MTTSFEQDLAYPDGQRPALPHAAPAAPGPLRDDAASAAVRGMFGRDSVYLVLWAVQLGVAALFTPVSTRLLGPSRFGLVASSIAIMQVLVALGSLGLYSAIQRAYAGPGGERSARRLITVALLSALIVFGVADATGPSWASALGLGHYPLAVRYAVTWAAASAVTNATLGLLRSRDQLLPFASVSLLQSIVAEGLSLGLVLAVRRSAAEYLLGQLVAQALAVAVGLALARPLPIRRRDLGFVADALRYSAPLVPMALSAFVLEASDRLVVQHDLGSAAVARYAVAYNIGSIPILLLTVLDMVWMPRVFALGDLQVRDSVLTRSRDALYALLIPIVAGLGLSAPILLRLWAPASYHPDKLLLVVGLVATSAILVAGGKSHTRLLLAAGRTGPVAVATLAAAGANLVLNIALVPRLGIEGSALATLLSYGVLHAWLAFAARQIRRLTRPGRMLVIELLGAIALAIAAAALPVSAPALGLRLAIGVLCAATFASMLSILGGVFRARQPRRLAQWMSSTVLRTSV